MSRLEHVVAVGHGVKAPREAETDTSTLFDLFYKDAKGDFHPMPAKYDDCEKFVSQRRPTVRPPTAPPALSRACTTVGAGHVVAQRPTATHSSQQDIFGIQMLRTEVSSTVSQYGVLERAYV